MTHLSRQFDRSRPERTRRGAALGARSALLRSSARRTPGGHVSPAASPRQLRTTAVQRPSTTGRPCWFLVTVFTAMKSSGPLA